MFYNILDQKRLDILPLLSRCAEGFYLAGGTALALQIGHRDSVDFDFFIQKDFDPQIIYEKCIHILKDHTVHVTQQEQNTLSLIIDDTVKLSFFTHTYNLLSPTIVTDHFSIASVTDIACMKLLAIVNRSTFKDYVDICVILQKHSLDEILQLAQKKYPHLDTNIILKSLVYFDDITNEPIIFKNDYFIDLLEIKRLLATEVKTYIDTI